MYLTDGRRTSVRGKNDDDNYRTVVWDGKKLVKKDKFVIKKGEDMDWIIEKTGGDQFKMSNKEEWTLSKDGKTLIQTISSGYSVNMPPPIPTRLIFRRQS